MVKIVLFCCLCLFWFCCFSIFLRRALREFLLGVVFFVKDCAYMDLFIWFVLSFMINIFILSIIKPEGLITLYKFIPSPASPTITLNLVRLMINVHITILNYFFWLNTCHIRKSSIHFWRVIFVKIQIFPVLVSFQSHLFTH